MPNTPSAKKRLRQSLERRDRNRQVKSTIRTQIKKVHAAVKERDVAKAEAEFRLAARRLDRAGAARVIHPNTASRYKSRLQRMIKKAKQPVA
jgi:small subunit ribosomal protein S20